MREKIKQYTIFLGSSNMKIRIRNLPFTTLRFCVNEVFKCFYQSNNWETMKAFSEYEQDLKFEEEQRKLKGKEFMGKKKYLIPKKL